MAKKNYISPVLLSGLTQDDDPTIIMGGSQGTSGYDSPYTFSGISQDVLDMIELNCDDFDLQDMDTDKDFVITLEEFEAWFSEHDPW